MKESLGITSPHRGSAIHWNPRDCTDDSLTPCWRVNL